MKTPIVSVICFTVLVIPSIAQSATRTVCLDVRFKDQRQAANCATNGEVGNLRGCSPASDMHHQGAVIELWDKDPNGTDEKIGNFLHGSTTTTCWTFEWDNNNSANAEREANPDVYPRYLNQVNNVANTRSVFARQSNGTAHATVSWRNGETGSPDIYTAVDCAVGTTCIINPGGFVVPSADTNSDIAKRAMVLDSAQHTLEVFGSIMTSNVNIRIPDTTGTCPTACATSRTNIQIPNALALDAIRVSHELGHTIQMQVFGQDNLRIDYTRGGNAGWNLTSDEFDSAASQEGFATYIGLASWYDGGVANTNPNVWGFTYETAAPFNATCTANRGLALQVAKAFWDLDDITNEAAAAPAAGVDADGHFPTTIAQRYNTFPNGTANRQKNESDANGVNVRDYRANTNFTTTQATTMLNHNCIESQDDL